MLVTVEDLALALNKSSEDEKLEPAIIMAEAIAAAHIGMDTLERTNRTEFITPVRDRQTLETSYGPITGVNEVTTEDGEPVHDSHNELTWKHWFLQTELGFDKGVRYNLNYTTGWVAVGDGASDLPATVKQAILTIASVVYERGSAGGTKSSERIGDWAATYSTPAVGESALLPRDAVLLLRQYRRPSL